MLTAARNAVLLALALLMVPSQATEITSLQKVIDMLNGMAAKGKAEKHEEEVEFAKFHEWCDNSRAEKENSIAEAKAQIQQLTADIDKAEADAETLAGEIADLESQIATAEADAAKATSVRDKERADYSATHQDFSESIVAIQRAVQVLSTRTADIPQSLMQLQSSKLIPKQAKVALESFLAMTANADAGAPEANAYEFQSGSVITMLEKLEAKFKDQLLGLEKEEINAKSNYELLMQQLTDDIKADKASVSDKTAARAGLLEDAATAKGDLAVTEKGKAEDEATLSDINSECTARSEEFEKNQVIRSEELKALAEATKILSSSAVTGNADTYLPAAALLQAKARAMTFSQLRAQPNADLAKRQRVASYLQSQSKKLGSRYLSVAATHVMEDPFGKVKKMIKDLIVKLMEQANEEADEKAFCDTELGTNKQTREIKAAEVDELTAKTEELTAKSTQLSVEITDLSDALAALAAQQAAATQMRGEEKATNDKTVSDAKEAQLAVEQAMQVLKDFYSQHGDAAFIQAQEPYKGMQVEGGNIMGFLEVILSDFARLESETSSAEDAAVAAYEKFMAESDQDAAVKNTEMSHKENSKTQTDEDNRSTKKQLELTQTELDSALDYYDKLKADCLDYGFSYSDRKKGREEEIASLQEALKVLDGQDLA